MKQHTASAHRVAFDRNRRGGKDIAVGRRADFGVERVLPARRNGQLRTRESDVGMVTYIIAGSFFIASSFVDASTSGGRILSANDSR